MSGVGNIVQLIMAELLESTRIRRTQRKFVLVVVSCEYFLYVHIIGACVQGYIFLGKTNFRIKCK